MSWSFKVARITGIDIYVHATFFLLLAWVVYSHYAPEKNVVEGAFWGLFILCAFGTVVLHELGHALAAKRYGIRTRDITLYPIGGIARLERIPEDPKQELVVAVAGPLVNVVIAVALAIGLAVSGIGFGAITADLMADVPNLGTRLIEQLLVVNIGLVVFNLLPAFPMDGGRVLRALLAMKMDYGRATQKAASVGQFMAMLFGLMGLLNSNFILLFIAFFVWTGAAHEAGAVQLRSALAGIPVKAAMITEFHVLAPSDSLKLAAGHVLAGFQQDFPVLEAGRPVGILTRSELVKGLSQSGPDSTVGDAMQRQFQTADPHEMLEGAFQRLAEGDSRSLPVMAGDKLVGIVTPENIGEFVMFREALRQHAGTSVSA